MRCRLCKKWQDGIIWEHSNRIEFRETDASPVLLVSFDACPPGCLWLARMSAVPLFLTQPSLRTLSLLTWWDLLGSWLWCGQGEGHWFLCGSQIIFIDGIRQKLHKMSDIKWPYSSRSYHHRWVMTGWLQELLWKEKWVTNWVGDHFLWQGFLRGGFQVRIVKSDMRKCLLT